MSALERWREARAPYNSVAWAWEIVQAGDDVVARVEELERDLEAERAARERAEAALRWLVRLKDGPRDALYAREKPQAWQAARLALVEIDRAREAQ